jgi:oligoribonuclease (3'-5' exoribonuclease)
VANVAVFLIRKIIENIHTKERYSNEIWHLLKDIDESIKTINFYKEEYVDVFKKK